ncbi:uncharacterized protein LOC141544675 [Sminthopsis crassicaudata]|uniref:uncharacterized protein LOC141544675 n=1 Tax=Sminthopsis crassicaudata TaxID=9301 RepID=UPI003D691682
MKLQSNYPGKSLPLNQNQLPFTKYEKIPSIIGEAIVGIGPVIDYKVGVQLEKPDPQKECSKDMKLQNNYPGKSLPLSQNQLASTRFGKMSSEEGEAVVGIGPVIDYKVGVKLEKPFPQKECSRDRKLQSNYPGKSLLWCQNQLPSTKFEKIPSKEDKAVIGIGPVIDYKIGVHLEKLVPQDFSKDMKLQDNYLSKSLPLSQNQLASTKFGKMPSEEGEAIVGIGPVVNYKVGIQLEKTVSQECSKDMKLQSNYTSKSLPLNQSQLPSSRFRKIPSQEEEVAVVGSGHVIDYKVGVHLEKPIPQKQYEPPLQKENWKEVKKDLEQELKYKEPSELPEMSSALANNLSDSVEKEKNKGPFSVGDLQSLSGQREDNPENVFLKDLKISFPKNVLQFSSYMCSKRRTPQSKNKPKIEPTCNVSEENIAYVAENIKRSDSKLVINEIKEDKLFGIEITFSQQKNITNLESDSGLLQSSGPGSHFGVQLMHSGNMTSINQEKKPELITARKCKKKTKHIETSFQNSHHNATSSINELRLGRHSLLYGDTISKMFLDKELKQDKQRLTNELGIMQAESLTFKKENIQPEKEVEEKKQNHQQNKMKTLDRKDDDKLTENRRASKANEQFSMESHQHGKDEENKIPAEEIPIMSISSKEYLVPVHHVLKG